MCPHNTLYMCPHTTVHMCPQVQALSLRLIRPLLQGEPESSEGEFTLLALLTLLLQKSTGVTSKRCEPESSGGEYTLLALL